MRVKGYYCVDTINHGETYFNIDSQVRTTDDCDKLIAMVKEMAKIIRQGRSKAARTTLGD